MRWARIASSWLCGSMLAAGACGGDDGVGSATKDSTSTSTTEATTEEPTGSTTTTGTTGAGELMRCEPRCTKDADCLYMGDDIGFRCIGQVCVYPACESDDVCIADLSGWAQTCEGKGDCGPNQECVDISGGAGRCASTPDAFVCADFGLAELSRTTVEGATVTVCGNGEVRCEAGECVDPCASDDECPPQMGHPTCEKSSGACICTSDQDCTGSMLPGFVVCIEGRCGCSTDADCQGGANVDTCYGGVCGCSSDATCTQKVFDGAVLACE